MLRLECGGYLMSIWIVSVPTTTVGADLYAAVMVS